MRHDATNLPGEFDHNFVLRVLNSYPTRQLANAAESACIAVWKKIVRGKSYNYAHGAPPAFKQLYFLKRLRKGMK